jgi:hypothetical protein
MFEFFENHPDRMSRFKDAMSFLQTFPGLENSYVLAGFDWASLGKATIVDVGGSHGQVSYDIARKFPDLSFIVQDLPKVVEDAKGKVPSDLADRVEFMAHDFFTEQPVKGADVYYFRWILHDWSDLYCVRILKALIPALKSGARIVLSERCLEPPCTVSHAKEKWNRFVDIFWTCNRTTQSDLFSKNQHEPEFRQISFPQIRDRTLSHPDVFKLTISSPSNYNQIQFRALHPLNFFNLKSRISFPKQLYPIILIALL